MRYALTDNAGLFSGSRGRALLLLIGVYTFNFIDRQIIGILAVPIKADLGLSDTQLGRMGGLAFALFYTALGIPIALLADRFNRTWIITVALVVWSGMTAVCGLANTFWQMFAARLGVGVGEAGGEPCDAQNPHGVLGKRIGHVAQDAVLDVLESARRRKPQARQISRMRDRDQLFCEQG